MASSLADDLARAVLGEPVLTSAEVAGGGGVSLDEARRLWRAMGFPPVAEDQRIFTAADAATLGAARALVAQNVTAPEVLVQLTRVMGLSLSRIAEAQIAARADTAEIDAATVAALANAVEPLLAYVWRRHLVAAALRAATTLTAEGEVQMVVGFADLVGFTAFSQRREPAELAAAVDRFEALAYEHIPERGGRVIKMIGDEVMFAVEEPAAAAAIALALVDAYGRDPQLPAVRVGLASGPVLAWQGDLYGPTVNLASRLVNIARPGTVLAAEELGAQLERQENLELRHLRGEHLKGIGRVRLWVVREKAS
ncbi:MAG TPA: adenylate/guanylate cyclase domain-containing protein [Candidatus Dormibacteraeota bacterium]|nr:adenylate/guanylate cyclase domain-containing protein [Candidatus Dormibacteraeota bacterium]